MLETCPCKNAVGPPKKALEVGEIIRPRDKALQGILSSYVDDERPAQ